MQNKIDESPVEPFVPWLQLLTFGGYILAAIFLFNLIGPLVAMPFYDFDFQKMVTVMSNMTEYPEARIPMLLTQAVYSVGAFILAPWYYIHRYLKIPLKQFINSEGLTIRIILLSIMITMSFMVVNSVFIYWNQQVNFPEFLSWFENMARAMEDRLEVVTLYITDFQSINQLLIGLVVIALLPAIGEELLFRGVLQNLIWKSSNSPHTAIWISAFIFGIFHLQFYGIIPRMMLGVLFGYLYFWSGRLSIAMIAHFINNAFTLIAVYFYNQGIIDYEVTDSSASPPIVPVLLFALLGGFSMYIFYRLFKMEYDGEMAEGV